jgi:hypothetical protein
LDHAAARKSPIVERNRPVLSWFEHGGRFRNKRYVTGFAGISGSGAGGWRIFPGAGCGPQSCSRNFARARCRRLPSRGSTALSVQRLTATPLSINCNALALTRSSSRPYCHCTVANASQKMGPSS